MVASRFGQSNRRRVILLLALAALSTSMLAAVRRSSEARRLSTELEVLERAAGTARSELAEAMVRADSLSSRSHVMQVGASLGLRPAAETEFEWLDEGQRFEGIARLDEVPAGQRGRRQ